MRFGGIVTGVTVVLVAVLLLFLWGFVTYMRNRGRTMMVLRTTGD